MVLPTTRAIDLKSLDIISKCLNPCTTRPLDHRNDSSTNSVRCGYFRLLRPSIVQSMRSEKVTVIRGYGRLISYPGDSYWRDASRQWDISPVTKVQAMLPKKRRLRASACCRTRKRRSEGTVRYKRRNACWAKRVAAAAADC